MFQAPPPTTNCRAVAVEVKSYVVLPTTDWLPFKATVALPTPVPPKVNPPLAREPLPMEVPVIRL